MPTVTIKMTDAQFAALEREARDRGTSKAGVLRDAFLNQRPAVADSSFDLISDLVGSVKGPRDLSTNPKFMKGYGKPRNAGKK